MAPYTIPPLGVPAAAGRVFFSSAQSALRARVVIRSCLLLLPSSPLLPARARPLNVRGTYHVSVACGLTPEGRIHNNDLSSHPQVDIHSQIDPPNLMSQQHRDHKQIMSKLGDGGVVWSKRFIKIDRMDSKKHLNLLSNADKYLQINRHNAH